MILLIGWQEWWVCHSLFSHLLLSCYLPSSWLYKFCSKCHRSVKCFTPTISRSSNYSGILKHLHWLPIEQCIHFKLAALIHNSLCSTQPACAYLHSLFNYHTPTRSLRSANTNLLSVPRVHTAFASRGFSVAACTVWNSLPSGIRDSSSTHTFRRLLKTHCFQQAFGSP